MTSIQILIFPVKPYILEKHTAPNIGQLGKKYVYWDNDPSQALANQIYNEEIDMQFLRPDITSTRSEPNNLVLATEPLIENNLEQEYFQYNINNLEQAIQRYNKTERALGDVLSRDHDVFDNPTKTQIYVVVLLLNITYNNKVYKFYQGHVYTWIFDKNPQNCWMIGIRNRVDTIFRRLDQVTARTSLPTISKYLLEGVRQFALSKNCERIVVAQPLSTMKQILQKYGFKPYDIKPNEVGVSPFKINALFGWFLSYDNLQQPFISDSNIEVKMYTFPKIPLPVGFSFPEDQFEEAIRFYIPNSGERRLGKFRIFTEDGKVRYENMQTGEIKNLKFSPYAEPYYGSDGFGDPKNPDMLPVSMMDTEGEIPGEGGGFELEKNGERGIISFMMGAEPNNDYWDFYIFWYEALPQSKGFGSAGLRVIEFFMNYFGWKGQIIPVNVTPEAQDFWERNGY